MMSAVCTLLDASVKLPYLNERMKHFAHCISLLQGTPCDLVTGEERKYAEASGKPSSHVSCTVEMTSVNIPCK